MANQRPTEQQGTSSAGLRDATTHTGSADPNQAADAMKNDKHKAARSSSGGSSRSEGADTDGAGSAGMVDEKDASGGGAGVGGSSGSGG